MSITNLILFGGRREKLKQKCFLKHRPWWYCVDRFEFCLEYTCPHDRVLLLNKAPFPCGLLQNSTCRITYKILYTRLDGFHGLVGWNGLNPVIYWKCKTKSPFCDKFLWRYDILFTYYFIALSLFNTSKYITWVSNFYERTFS